MTKYDLRPEELFESIPSELLPFFKEVTYVWELLPKIKEIVKNIIRESPQGLEKLKEGVLVGKNVTIAPTASIIGPAIIEDEAEIGPGAYIRENVYIGKRCVVGHASEVKNCILLPNASLPHYNYVGDSILGKCAHMGASSICSNLKGDGKPIVVHAEKDYETGLRKFGAILGDGVEIGCGAVLNPGTIIGKGSHVYPLVATRGVYQRNVIVKATKTVVDKK